MEDTIIRNQNENHIKPKLIEDIPEEDSVSVPQLYRYATGFYKFVLYLGVFSALAGGFSFSYQFVAYRMLLADSRERTSQMQAGMTFS